ncbi:hypothetical protein CHARACLAT_009497 [Characodon lateralis]|uniref:Uncharacterized protein n=1 Tax=Characodon lateralis TaxID=208331 RepID=A0ABU7CWC8_9TELE|nr:hypothetical protein [Characodon lateralis]
MVLLEFYVLTNIKECIIVKCKEKDACFPNVLQQTIKEVCCAFLLSTPESIISSNYFNCDYRCFKCFWVGPHTYQRCAFLYGKELNLKQIVRGVSVNNQFSCFGLSSCWTLNLHHRQKSFAHINSFFFHDLSVFSSIHLHINSDQLHCLQGRIALHSTMLPPTYFPMEMMF